jgi:hypothetical protein
MERKDICNQLKINTAKLIYLPYVNVRMGIEIRARSGMVNDVYLMQLLSPLYLSRAWVSSGLCIYEHILFK